MGFFTLYCLFLIPNVICFPEKANKDLVSGLNNKEQNVKLNYNEKLEMPLKFLNSVGETASTGSFNNYHPYHLIRPVHEFVKRSLDMFQTGIMNVHNGEKKFNNGPSDQRSFDHKCLMSDIIKQIHSEASLANDDRNALVASNCSRCSVNRDRPWNKICCPKENQRSYVRPWNVRNCTECASSSACQMETECMTMSAKSPSPCPTACPVTLKPCLSTIVSKKLDNQTQIAINRTNEKNMSISVPMSATGIRIEVVKTTYLPTAVSYTIEYTEAATSHLSAKENFKNQSDLINMDGRNLAEFSKHFTQNPRMKLTMLDTDLHTVITRGETYTSGQPINFPFDITPQAQRNMEGTHRIPSWLEHHDVTQLSHKILRGQYPVKDKKNVVDFLDTANNDLQENLRSPQNYGQLQTFSYENNDTPMKNNNREEIKPGGKEQSRRNKSHSSRWHYRKAQQQIRHEQKIKRYKHNKMNTLRRSRLKNDDKRRTNDHSIQD